MGKILIVEDDEIFLSNLKRFVNKRGHSFEVISCMDDYTLENMRNTDVILMDIMLPRNKKDNNQVSDGGVYLALLQFHMFHTNGIKDIPIIFISVYNKDEYSNAILTKVSGLNIICHMEKPISSNELQMHIDRFVGKGDCNG